MRAMMLEKSAAADESPLVLRDAPMPAPGRGEVRVKVHASGICHTDLHIVEGDLSPHKRPVIPGHQIVGRIDALGPGVATHKEGDRVGVPWLYSVDGSCEFCRRDLENLCVNARFTGYDADGG